jgi:hypothetical protein
VDVVDGRSRSGCPARHFRTDLREVVVGVCHKRDSELEGWKTQGLMFNLSLEKCRLYEKSL